MRPLDGVNRMGPRIARRGLVVAVGPVWRRAHGLRVDGAERLPRRPGALLMACNHAAFIDTVHLTALVAPRFVVVGAKPRLFRDPGRRTLMRLGNVLRVDDEEQVVRDAVSLLRQDQLLLAYPERGRFPTRLGPFSPWVARAALRARVEILPLHLSGTGTEGGEIRLRVGTRLVPEGPEEALTARLRQSIEGLGA